MTPQRNIFTSHYNGTRAGVWAFRGRAAETRVTSHARARSRVCQTPVIAVAATRRVQVSKLSHHSSIAKEKYHLSSYLPDYLFVGKKHPLLRIVKIMEKHKFKKDNGSFIIIFISYATTMSSRALLKLPRSGAMVLQSLIARRRRGLSFFSSPPPRCIVGSFIVYFILRHTHQIFSPFQPSSSFFQRTCLHLLIGLMVFCFFILYLHGFARLYLAFFTSVSLQICA